MDETQLVKAPAGKMVAQMNEPMKIMQTITPVSIKSIGRVNISWIWARIFQAGLK